MVFLRNRIQVLSNELLNSRLRSFVAVVFGIKQERVCNLLLVIDSNLGPILSCFRGIASFPHWPATSALYT